MTDSIDLALKIMALVDECPSEPFSFERKQIELKLEEMISRHTQQIDDELQESFELGYDEAKHALMSDHEQEVRELEEQINDLETEVEDLQKQLAEIVEGYETGYRQA